MKILMMDERIKQSETRQFKAIFPDSLNANGTLFGGQAMKWMDEVAYITATRFTRQRMFTVNTENIYFLKTVQPNSIVEIIGRVESVGVAKLRVKVVESVFVFANLDNNMKPQRIDGFK